MSLQRMVIKFDRVMHIVPYKYNEKLNMLEITDTDGEKYYTTIINFEEYQIYFINVTKIKIVP